MLVLCAKVHLFEGLRWYHPAKQCQQQIAHPKDELVVLSGVTCCHLQDAMLETVSVKAHLRKSRWIMPLHDRPHQHRFEAPLQLLWRVSDGRAAKSLNSCKRVPVHSADWQTSSKDANCSSDDRLDETVMQTDSRAVSRFLRSARMPTGLARGFNWTRLSSALSWSRLVTCFVCFCNAGTTRHGVPEEGHSSLDLHRELGGGGDTGKIWWLTLLQLRDESVHCLEDALHSCAHEGQEACVRQLQDPG